MYLYKIETFYQKKDIELITYYFDYNKLTKIKKIIVNYSIYINLKDFEYLIKTLEIIENQDFKIVEFGYSHFKIDKIIKVNILFKELYEIIKKKTLEYSIKLYELDLHPSFKYLIDNQIKIYDKDEINISPKLLYFDIETMTCEKMNLETEIISLSVFSCDNLSKCFLNTEFLENEKIDKIKQNKKTDYEIIYCNNEKELLEKFIDCVNEFSPQIIMGWNVIDFDFKVVIEKMKKHKIEKSFSKFGSDLKLKINPDFFRASTLDINGILVFDIIELLKINFINFPDYKLDTVAKIVLKDSKINLEEENSNETILDKQKQINNLYLNNPDKLLKYNFKDSLLCSQILEKLDIIKLILSRSAITNTPLLKIKSPIASLDIMYLTQLHKQKIVAKTNVNYHSSSQIMGAYVIEPKLDYYKNIFVYDFKSLYPNIIRTFNLDPFSIKENGEIKTITDLKFVKNKIGILPNLITQLSNQRDKAKKENNLIKQNAIKVTMNSFYGAISSSKSRFHNFELGQTITGFGRDIIKKTKEFIEKIGHCGIYGDTDSIFIQPKNFNNINETDTQKINLLGIELTTEINNFILNYSKTFNSPKNYLQIEFEKIYSKFFIATKKRYVGFNLFKKKLNFVGMEFVRGDWTELAKEFQYKLVEIIFKNYDKKEILETEIKNYIVNYTNDLEKGLFDKKLIYFKKLTKDLIKYTKIEPPHVKAAREVENFSGRLVKYVLTKNGAKHISKINKDTIYDYKHYIEKQLYGVSSDLLKPLKIDFLDIIYKKKQKGLNEFF
jgi:DNA polymerase-2